MLKDVYTVRDISEQLQVKEKAVRHLIKTGRLKATKVLNKWIVSAHDFQALTQQEERSGKIES